MAGTTTQKTQPVSRRGAATRASLVAAARTIFERDGFLDARIVDIAAEAGVAIGSFYTYFADKDDIFLAMMGEVQEEMLNPQPPDGDGRPGDLASRLEASNRAFLESYRQNAKLMGVLEQVSVIDERFREHRQANDLAFIERNTRLIKRLQDEGLADPSVDPLIAAWALGGMVSRIAFRAFVLEEPLQFEQVVQTITRLWLNSLQVQR